MALTEIERYYSLYVGLTYRRAFLVDLFGAAPFGKLHQRQEGDTADAMRIKANQRRNRSDIDTPQ